MNSFTLTYASLRIKITVCITTESSLMMTWIGMEKKTLRKEDKARQWWCMPITAALGRQRRANL